MATLKAIPKRDSFWTAFANEGLSDVVNAQPLRLRVLNFMSQKPVALRHTARLEHLTHDRARYKTTGVDRE